MQELEKILEEIDQEVKEYMEIDFGDEYNAGIKDMAEMSKKIIRKYMNDGWIPAEERLPEVGDYVLGTNKYGEVLVYHYGWNSPHTRKMFFHLCGAAVDIIAWRPLPEPYRPKNKTEAQDWREDMLRKFDRRD